MLSVSSDTIKWHIVDSDNVHAVVSTLTDDSIDSIGILANTRLDV